MHNQRFLLKTVTEFHSRHNHLEFDDLVSEANIGLMRAAEKFDPETGNRFITYARYWILQALTRFSDQHSLPARLPEHRAEELKKLRKTVQETKSQDIKSLAISSGLDEESVRLLLPFLNGTVSLDAPVSTPSGEEGASLGDLVCPVTVDFTGNLLTQELLEVIEKLPQRHAEILMHRFGAFGRRRMTLQEIADRYGITRERVRQIESKALAMCRSLGKHIA